MVDTPTGSVSIIAALNRWRSREFTRTRTANRHRRPRAIDRFRCGRIEQRCFVRQMIEGNVAGLPLMTGENPHSPTPLDAQRGRRSRRRQSPAIRSFRSRGLLITGQTCSCPGEARRLRQSLRRPHSASCDRGNANTSSGAGSGRTRSNPDRVRPQRGVHWVGDMYQRSSLKQSVVHCGQYRHRRQCSSQTSRCTEQDGSTVIRHPAPAAGRLPITRNSRFNRADTDRSSVIIFHSDA